MAKVVNRRVIHSNPLWLAQTQTWLFNQCKFLPEGIENHIVCERTANLDQFQIPNIHTLNKLRFSDKLAIRLRTRLMGSDYSNFLLFSARMIEADILHSHFGYIGWTNLDAAHQAVMKHVVTFYGLDVTFLPKAFFLWYSRYKDMFNKVDQILCEGPFMARTVIENLGCPEHKIQVHHLGIDLDHIKYVPRKWDRTSPLKILIAASFREKKGIPYALEALGQISSQLEIQITIIGDAGQKTEKAKILEIIDRYNLARRTRMLGYQPVSVMFAEAYESHIFLSPSVTAKDGDTEGGAPVSIIEMAATGMPVVSSFHCDIPEVIQHEETGLLSEERDVNAIRANLVWLICNPDKWETMTRKAREHIEKEFNATTQGERLAQIYGSL